MSFLPCQPLPLLLVLHAANGLQATELGAWGRGARSIWLLPPSGKHIRLAVAHYEKGGHAFEDALSKPGTPGGDLLLKHPTGLAAALRNKIQGHLH